MTVQELIQKLHTFDPTLRVVTPGFDESDFEDMETLEIIHLDFHDELAPFHGGRHRLVRHGPGGVPALNINYK